MEMFDKSMIWFVIFHPAQGEWWTRKFRHVSLAGYANETWLHIDVQRKGVGVAAIYSHDEVTDFLSFLLAHYTVVKFGPALGNSRHFLQPMSCVSFVKHTLGVRSGALRPDGLFRTLVQNYGSEVQGETQRSNRDDKPETATAQG